MFDFIETWYWSCDDRHLICHTPHLCTIFFNKYYTTGPLCFFFGWQFEACWHPVCHFLGRIWFSFPLFRGLSSKNRSLLAWGLAFNTLATVGVMSYPCLAMTFRIPLQMVTLDSSGSLVSMAAWSLDDGSSFACCISDLSCISIPLWKALAISSLVKFINFDVYNLYLSWI